MNNYEEAPQSQQPLDLGWWMDFLKNVNGAGRHQIHETVSRPPAPVGPPQHLPAVTGTQRDACPIDVGATFRSSPIEQITISKLREKVSKERLHLVQFTDKDGNRGYATYREEGVGNEKIWHVTYYLVLPSDSDLSEEVVSMGSRDIGSAELGGKELKEFIIKGFVLANL